MGRAHDVPVVRASAKTGLGVGAAFMTLVKLLPPSARHRIVMLGCSGSGKSALTTQFTLNVFFEQYVRIRNIVLSRLSSLWLTSSR